MPGMLIILKHLCYARDLIFRGPEKVLTSCRLLPTAQVSVRPGSDQFQTHFHWVETRGCSCSRFLAHEAIASQWERASVVSVCVCVCVVVCMRLCVWVWERHWGPERTKWCCEVVSQIFKARGWRNSRFSLLSSGPEEKVKKQQYLIRFSLWSRSLILFLGDIKNTSMSHTVGSLWWICSLWFQYALYDFDPVTHPHPHTHTHTHTHTILLLLHWPRYKMVFLFSWRWALNKRLFPVHNLR